MRYLLFYPKGSRNKTLQRRKREKTKGVEEERSLLTPQMLQPPQMLQQSKVSVVVVGSRFVVQMCVQCERSILDNENSLNLKMSEWERRETTKKTKV